MSKHALIIVDVQNDFLPGGALAVPDGDQVVPVINRVMTGFDLICATKDWHPENHGSFVTSHPGKKQGDIIKFNGIKQILWPPHCVQNTTGSKFAPELNKQNITKVFFKGTDPGIDSYSTFYDNAHRRSTGLGDYLKENQVSIVYLAGLATDYCVKYSALDARELKFETFVIEDGCRGIDLNPGDVEYAWKEMNQAGVSVIHSDQI